MSLRRTSLPETPLYQGVKEHIRRHIQEGRWVAGDRVSSEHELVAELGVSRMTVNRALRELSDQGVLKRVAGVGTFVAEEKPQSGLLQVANLAEEIRGRGHRHSFDLIQAEAEPCNAEVAHALGLRVGERVFHVVCQHRENGLPVQLEDRFVNPGAVPDFLEQDFHRLQPGEYLRVQVPLDEVEHLVDAISATAFIASHLGIRPGEPCLVLTRRTWSAQVPVTFVRCIHPGTRYRLGTRFQVSGPQSVG